MSALERFPLFLNAAAILAWVPAFVGPIDGFAFAALALTVCALLLSSVALLRRERSDVPTAKREAADKTADELDAHTVLDLDARLEALERAQLDAVDAARWRALVESGQVSGPAATIPWEESSAPRQPMANGR